MGNEIKKVKIGDKIRAKGCTFEVAEILSQDIWIGWENDEVVYYLEFLDTKGKYHYWKSDSDGGYVIRA